jgi:hypothetical protein
MDTPVPPALETLLSDAGSAVATGPTTQVVLSVLEVSEPTTERDDRILAETWMSTIGREIPRSVPQREELTREVLAKHRDLRPLVRRWQRELGEAAR